MNELGKQTRTLYREQRQYLRGTAEAMQLAIRNQFKHNWRQTLPVLVFPAIMALSAIAFPDTISQVIADLWGIFSVLLFAGILLTFYRGVRLHRRFSLLMACSMSLALAMLFPFVFLLDINNRWLAAIVIYNVCLALYALISFSIYLLLMGFKPPREPYA
ncbi:MAG: hypothetical protein KGZ86_08535 [Candidatus Latescibacteria bacterium]|nr:hypothetical protein [Candidatus Latescibacterota bacterium]